MTNPVIARRIAQRDRLLDTARTWAADLAGRVPIRAAVVVGSVARGDFNRWSDLDVLVIADELPATAQERLELVARNAPPGLQPVAWTTSELDARRERDPMAREAQEKGVTVWGTFP